MKVKLAIVISLLILLTLGGYLYSRRRSGSATSSDTPASQSPQMTANESAEFAEAVKSGRPTRCAVTKDGETMTYLIKGKTMRADFNISVSDAKTGSPAPAISHMVNDSQYIYLWSDGQKEAGKFPVPTEQEIQNLSETVKQELKNNPSLSNEADYKSLQDAGYTVKCQSSDISDSDLVPPSDIKFVDYSAMMKLPGASGTPSVDLQKLQEQFGGQNQ